VREDLIAADSRSFFKSFSSSSRTRIRRRLVKVYCISTILSGGGGGIYPCNVMALLHPWNNSSTNIIALQSSIPLSIPDSNAVVLLTDLMYWEQT